MATNMAALEKKLNHERERDASILMTNETLNNVDEQT